MDCKTANRMIQPYINNELELEQAEGLLQHICSCEECKEELEVFFLVQKGIEQLEDPDSKNYDIKGQFDENIRKTQQIIRYQHIWDGIKHVLFFGAIAGIAFVSVLQVSIGY